MTPFDDDSVCPMDAVVSDARTEFLSIDEGLSAICSGRRCRFRHDEVLCGSEDHDGYVHLVESGWAIEERPFEDGRRLIVDFIIPGDVVGLNGVFLDRPHGEVVSLTDMRTVQVPGGRLLDRMSDNPEAAGSLLKVHLETSARMNERLVMLGRNAWERTAYLFLELWQRMSSRGLAEGSSFQLPASQSVLADATGLSTVHFNRTLQHLRRERMLEFERGRVNLLNAEELADCLCIELEPIAAADASFRTPRHQLARQAALARL